MYVAVRRYNGVPDSHPPAAGPANQGHGHLTTSSLADDATASRPRSLARAKPPLLKEHIIPPFPGQTDLAPQTTLRSARAGRHLDFARTGQVAVCFMVLAPERGHVPVVGYRQVCLGLQPFARLV